MSVTCAALKQARTENVQHLMQCSGTAGAMRMVDATSEWTKRTLM